MDSGYKNLISALLCDDAIFYYIFWSLYLFEYSIYSGLLCNRVNHVTLFIASRQVPAMHLNNAFRIIKEVQKKFKQFESEKKEMEDVIEQETLKITQTKGEVNLG